MLPRIAAIAGWFRSLFAARSDLLLENLALRQQLAILTAKRPRPRMRTADRFFWVVLRRGRTRDPITAAERESFDRLCRRKVEEEYTQQGILPMLDLQHRERASIERVAISRALIEGGFLLIRRRRIPPPISIFRTRKIS